MLQADLVWLPSVDTLCGSPEGGTLYQYLYILSVTHVIWDCCNVFVRETVGESRLGWMDERVLMDG